MATITAPNNVLTIPLAGREKEHLSRMALRYGLSLPEFTRKILAELEEAVPTERLDDYENPQALAASLNRALADWRTDRIQTRL